jgi:hypothetical protein
MFTALHMIPPRSLEMHTHTHLFHILSRIYIFAKQAFLPEYLCFQGVRMARVSKVCARVSKVTGGVRVRRRAPATCQAMCARAEGCAMSKMAHARALAGTQAPTAMQGTLTVLVPLDLRDFDLFVCNLGGHMHA